MMIIYLTKVFRILYGKKSEYPVINYCILIVTISTVGFGDVTPQHPLTKVILIALIITGISTIALTSETVIDKLIQQRLENHYYLPDKPLDYIGHIIIVGFDNIVLNLTRLLTDRFLKVIIICDNSDKVFEARRIGFEAYTADSQYPDVLETISITKAVSLYLFHDKDNLAIQTSNPKRQPCMSSVSSNSFPRILAQI